jgi:hypothetical protein
MALLDRVVDGAIIHKSGQVLSGQPCSICQSTGEHDANQAATDLN